MTIREMKRFLQSIRERLDYKDVFVLENGTEYKVDDPIEYLFIHGVDTPQGRIVGYKHPESGVDALTLSIYETIDDAIQNGGLQFCLGKLVNM